MLSVCEIRNPSKDCRGATIVGILSTALGILWYFLLLQCFQYDCTIACGDCRCSQRSYCRMASSILYECAVKHSCLVLSCSPRVSFINEWNYASLPQRKACIHLTPGCVDYYNGACLLLSRHRVCIWKICMMSLAYFICNSVTYLLLMKS